MCLEVKYYKGLKTPQLCLDFDTDKWKLELPIEYYNDEEKLSEILKRAKTEIDRK